MYSLYKILVRRTDALGWTERWFKVPKCALIWFHFLSTTYVLKNGCTKSKDTFPLLTVNYLLEYEFFINKKSKMFDQNFWGSPWFPKILVGKLDEFEIIIVQFFRLFCNRVFPKHESLFWFVGIINDLHPWHLNAYLVSNRKIPKNN